MNETGINPRSGVTEPRFALCAGSSAQWLLRECGALSVMAFLPLHFWTVPKNCTVRQNPQIRPRLYGGGGGRDLPAGVHQGSFSQFFPSKQGLVLAVLAMYGQPIRDLWEAGRQTAPCGSASSERLHRPSVCMVSVSRAADNWMGAPLGNLALELGSQDPVVRQKLHAMFTAWACGIERGWREAMASGALLTLDLGTTAQTVVAYFGGVMTLA
jgi:TetR/AcrR family transcriptional regulator, transcriptional repressor for nem operon